MPTLDVGTLPSLGPPGMHPLGGGQGHDSVQGKGLLILLREGGHCMALTNYFLISSKNDISSEAVKIRGLIHLFNFSVFL